MYGNEWGACRGVVGHTAREPLRTAVQVKPKPGIHVLDVPVLVHHRVRYDIRVHRMQPVRHAARALPQPGKQVVADSSGVGQDVGGRGIGPQG